MRDGDKQKAELAINLISSFVRGLKVEWRGFDGEPMGEVSWFKIETFDHLLRLIATDLRKLRVRK